MTETYGMTDRVAEWVSKTNSRAYGEIVDHYGKSKAKRSGVPLMRHINQGLDWMLRTDKCNFMTLEAWCIHPLIQGDKEFQENALMKQAMFHGWSWTLALEYRRAANAYLCKPHTDKWTDEDVKAQVGWIPHEVRYMLLADKHQNQADFILHHYGTHERSKQLDRYFARWLRILDADVEIPFAP